MILKYPEAQIEKLASTDSTRASITEPYLRGDRLMATNGAALVSYPVIRETEDTDGPIPGELLVKARKLAQRKSGKQVHAKACAGAKYIPIAAREKEPLVIKCLSDSLVLSDASSSPRPENLSYPNFETVYPLAGRQELVVSLDAALLLLVAQAMNAPSGSFHCKGSRSITLRIGIEGPVGAPVAANAPIRVETADSAKEGIVALLMPIRRKEG